MQVPWIALCLAAALSLVLTPVARRLSVHYGIIDVPRDNRRMHKRPIPRAGGLGMVASFLIVLFLCLPMTPKLFALAAGSLIIAATGLLDDLRDLKPRTKLICQIVAALVLILGGVRITFFTDPFNAYGLVALKVLMVPVTLFWIVGITNTVNLIDGLDGLAAGVSMICALSLMAIAGRFGNAHVSLIAAILAGVCLGFLPYNFNPASVFMGDVGALFLGFVLSYISIEGVMKSTALITVVFPVLILGVPIFDTTFAIIRRILSGRNVMSADKGHLHHRLLAKGLTQRETVSCLYLISAVFGLLANLVSRLPSQVGFGISLVIVLAVVVIAFYAGMFSHREE